MMRLEDHGNVAHLVLDMPDRNANVWNQESLNKFGECLKKFQESDQYKGLIITSAKSSFLAGGDLDLLHAQGVTLFHAILLATGLDDCVHLVCSG